MPVLVISAAAVAESGIQGVTDFASSFVISQSAVAFLKLCVEKRRPNGSCCDSFPSGHTSSSFVSAAFIHARYGLKYAVPLYLAAAYTGYSRVYSKKHYPVDVVAGALTGVSAAFFMTEKIEQPVKNRYLSGKKEGWQLSSPEGSGGSGLYLTYYYRFR